MMGADRSDNRLRTRDFLLCGLFAGLTALGSLIRIPLAVGAISLQFLFTALSGLLLGAKRAMLSQAVYVLLGLIGLPIFASGGGLGYVLYPSFGFVLGLIPAAWLIGRIGEGGDTAKRCILSCCAGLLLLYVIGFVYLYGIVNLYEGRGVAFWTLLQSGVLVFLPGDGVKLLAIAVLAPRLMRNPQLRYFLR